MATQAVPTWSTTADNNDDADPAVNWAEGMSPSAVNNSARAEMASVAKWRDDLYGKTAGLSTGGSSTAYTVTTNATYASAAAMSGAIFSIIPHTTSGASPTLAVDGLTARALNVSTGVAIPTGALISGTPYLVRYVHATTEFIVLISQAYSNLYLPSGGVINWNNGDLLLTHSAGTVTLTGGDVAFGGAFAVQGDVDFSDRLDVGTNLEVGGTLAVSGVATFTAATMNIGNTRVTITNDANDCFRLNRLTSTGTMAVIQNAGVTVGSITQNGTNTSYNTSSDGRLKPVRVGFDPAPILDQLTPVKHNWLSTPDRWSHGLIAQDAYAVFPEAVTVGSGEPGDDDFMPWAVDYSKFVPLLIAELKSLRLRVAELESR